MEVSWNFDVCLPSKRCQTLLWCYKVQTSIVLDAMELKLCGVVAVLDIFLKTTNIKISWNGTPWTHCFLQTKQWLHLRTFYALVLVTILFFQSCLGNYWPHDGHLRFDQLCIKDHTSPRPNTWPMSRTASAGHGHSFIISYAAWKKIRDIYSYGSEDSAETPNQSYQIWCLAVQDYQGMSICKFVLSRLHFWKILKQTSCLCVMDFKM